MVGEFVPKLGLVVIRTFAPPEVIDVANSSATLSGRRPAVPLLVRNVLAEPVAVPTPPELVAVSPRRKGTIWVFLTRLLMPDAAPAVVPTSVGAFCSTRRATLVRLESSLPRPMPFTRAVPPPLEWLMLVALTTAVL